MMTADQTKFDLFCSTCVSFAWLLYAMGELTFGLVYVVAALEWMTIAGGAGGIPGVCAWLSMWPVWYFCPWLPLALVSAIPLIERKFLFMLLRLPLILVAIT